MYAHLRWPDGTAQRVYSPSLVLAEHVSEGASYPVADLVDRLRTALAEASDRVRASYGFACSRAAASVAAIEAQAERHQAGDAVVVEALER